MPVKKEKQPIADRLGANAFRRGSDGVDQLDPRVLITPERLVDHSHHRTAIGRVVKSNDAPGDQERGIVLEVSVGSFIGVIPVDPKKLDGSRPGPRYVL